MTKTSDSPDVQTSYPRPRAPVKRTVHEHPKRLLRISSFSLPPYLLSAICRASRETADAFYFSSRFHRPSAAFFTNAARQQYTRRVETDNDLRTSAPTTLRRTLRVGPPIAVWLSFPTDAETVVPSSAGLSRRRRLRIDDARGPVRRVARLRIRPRRRPVRSTGPTFSRRLFSTDLLVGIPDRNKF